MRYVVFLILMTFGSLAAFAQSAQPTPTPSDTNDVVRISTDLVQVDVTVTDSKGKSIRDLRPDEIEIYENGKKQDISNFSFVSAGSVSTPADSKSTSKQQSAEPLPVLPSTPLKAGAVRRTIAIVVDDLSLSFPSTKWAKEALIKYVNEQVSDGDLVAILRTQGGLGALQQFTTDKRLLLAAAQRIRFSTYGGGGASNFEPIEASTKELAQGDRDPRARDLGPDIELERQQQLALSSQRSAVFTTGTLGALNFIVRSMDQLPGRKSIVLISDGFALNDRDQNGNPIPSPIMGNMRRLTEQANRAAVTIYSIDARGLVDPSLRAEDDLSGKTASQRFKAVRDRENLVADTQQGLRYLADETGGISYINQNDINKGMQRVIEDQSYYLVGYQPDSETFDPTTNKFNKLVVKVTRDGAKVRYRSGFFSISDEQAAKQKAAGANALSDALTSPFAQNDVPLRLYAFLSTDEKRQVWVQSYVSLDAKDLKFVDAGNGTIRANFDIAAATFGDNGLLADQRQKSYTVTMTQDAYQKSLKTGLVYKFAFLPKKAGPYQCRVVIRDSTSKKMGSASEFVQVPDIKRGDMVLSGIALEAVSKKDFQQVSTRTTDAESEAIVDTAVRRFRQGDVLRYGVEIYNPKSGAAGDLLAEMRIFSDGKLKFEGKPTPVNAAVAATSVEYVGGLNLGRDMAPGDYILQIVVRDPSGKKDNLASQFVPFEVVP